MNRRLASTLADPPSGKSRRIGVKGVEGNPIRSFPRVFLLPE